MLCLSIGKKLQARGTDQAHRRTRRDLSPFPFKLGNFSHNIKQPEKPWCQVLSDLFGDLALAEKGKNPQVKHLVPGERIAMLKFS